MIDRSSITEADRNVIRNFIKSSEKVLWPSLVAEMYNLQPTIAALLLQRHQPKATVRRVI